MTFTESRPVPDLQLANKGGGGSNVSSRQNSLRQSSLRQNSVRVGGMKQGGGVEIVIPDDAPPNFETLLDVAVAEQLGQGKAPSSEFWWALAACMIGQMMEFFDFSVYAFFAPEIGKLFFPKGNNSLRAVKTFSVFAGGFLMRPLGSFILGAVGDRYGTAVALRWSIALMCIPTVVTGCLPTVHQIGPAATILLTIMRLLQGMSVGGELVGAVLHISDQKRTKASRGMVCGIVAGCAGLGNLMGSAVSSIVHRALPEAEILRWGWRVPFLCGSALGLVGFFLRSQGSSSMGAAPATSTQASQSAAAMVEEGKEVAEEDVPPPRTASCWQVLRGLRREDLPRLLVVLVVSGLIHMLFYNNLVWLGTYLASLARKPIPAYTAFAVVCVMQAFCFILVPTWGFLGDRTGGRLIYITVGSVCVAIAQPLLWRLLQYGSVDYAFLFAVTMAPIHTMVMSGNFWGWVTGTLGQMPSRYLCISVAYNIGAMMGGAQPMIASALSTSHVHNAPVLPISAFAVLTFLVLIASGQIWAEIREHREAAGGGKLSGGSTPTHESSRQ